MRAGSIRALRAPACTVLLLIGIAADTGCFPPPNPKPDVLEDSGTPSETDAGPEEALDETDAIPESDVNPGDTVTMDEGPDSIPDSDSLACERNDECVALAAPPCTVGVCDNHRCAKQFASVACDDRDPCTAEDRCAEGACLGRHFTAAEAAGWSVVWHAEGEGASIWPTDVKVVDGGFVAVVGRFVGTVDFGNDTLLESRPAGSVFHALLRASGALVHAHLVEFAGPTDRLADAQTVTPHGLERDAGDFGTLVLGAITRESGADATSLVRLGANGSAVWAPADWMPGTISRVVPVSESETLVFGSFAGEVAFRMNTGALRNFTAHGPNDLFVARIDEDREAITVEVMGTDGRDTGAFVAPGPDGVTWCMVTSTLVAGAMPEIKRSCVLVLPDGSVSIAAGWQPADAGVPYTGTTLGNGRLVAGWVETTSAEWLLSVRGFEPGASTSQWSYPFSVLPNALSAAAFGGPTPIALGRDATVVVWPMPDFVSAAGWSDSQVGGEGNTRFGVFSSSGILASTWQLPGFVATEASPTGGMSVAGKVAADVTLDEGLVVSAMSSGVNFDSGGGPVTTLPRDGVVVKYSPAHVWGCPVAP